MFETKLLVQCVFGIAPILAETDVLALYFYGISIVSPSEVLFLSVFGTAGLRPSTLSLGHGGSPPYLIFTSDE